MHDRPSFDLFELKPTLDASSFPTYPIAVTLEYAARTADFPVQEPRVVPQGFTLRGVTMEFINPFPEAFPWGGEPWFLAQTVVQHYGDARGRTITLAQFNYMLPEQVRGADRRDVAGRFGWSKSMRDGAWLAFDAGYPDAIRGAVVHILRGSKGVSLDELRVMAESIPGDPSPHGLAPFGSPHPGQPTPTPAPTPTPSPTRAGPPPTPTPTPSSTVGPIGPGPDELRVRQEIEDWMRRAGCGSEGTLDEMRGMSYAWAKMEEAKAKGDRLSAVRWEARVKEIETGLEKRCPGDRVITVSGPGTRGWTVLAKGRAVTLPEDAYLDFAGGIFECVQQDPQPMCPSGSAYGVRRGESVITYDPDNGTVYWVHLASGDTDAFAFFDGLLDWRPPKNAPPGYWQEGVLMMSGEMRWREWLPVTPTPPTPTPTLVSTPSPTGAQPR